MGFRFPLGLINRNHPAHMTANGPRFQGQLEKQAKGDRRQTRSKMTMAKYFNEESLLAPP